MFNSHFDMINYDEFPELIQKIYSKTIRECDSAFLLDTTASAIKKNEEILKTTKKMCYLLENFHKNLCSMAANIENNLENMIADLSAETKTEYVHHTFGGMLSFPGREKVEKPKKQIEQIPPEPEKPSPIVIPELSCRVTLNKVNKLSAIPPAFYWFVGSPEHSPGVYVNLSGQYIKVPFPTIVDPSNHDRMHTIRCKYGSKAMCSKKHIEISKIYRSAVRQCNFAHTGDEIIKLGHPMRCPNRQLFGNPQTIREDITYVHINDIKNLLLYGLNDLFTANIWFDYQTSKGIAIGVLENIERA